MVGRLTRRVGDTDAAGVGGVWLIGVRFGSWPVGAVTV